ncbi:biosynthetic-type acetolactate synthase large subunit [Dendrosporobacter sp. 1207_IL3150]|uniref:biosynthetic-type acetolactate synthase large subunit n=1 Tax=Dendrosporobacter sp. 1207_IL3150 TaxID=3084054 RepID=UPI002FD9258C
MKISGAKAVIECLLEQGVDTVFGYPGGMILPLYDALYDAEGINHILTVHEQGAAHAADGYARASGRVGVCIATSGPGATNLVTGLAAAYMDSVPVVAITGQVPTNLLGRDAFQEVDITGITMPITKHNFQIKDIRKLPQLLRQAFKIAKSGRPGPVLVDIPRDVLSSEFNFDTIPLAPVPEWKLTRRVESLIQEAAEVISKARRPVIVAGGGVISAGASNELMNLAEANQLPVVSTLMGLGSFPASHPQFLGLTGLHGWQAANNAVHDADVIIAAGSRFSDRLTGNRAQYSTDKVVIHIDIDPAEIDKNVLTHLGLAGEMRTILSMLKQYTQPGNTDEWWSIIDSWKKQYVYNYDESILNVPWVMRKIAESTADKSVIFTTDVGQHQMWAAQHLKIEKPRTWLTSGGLGAMGFGLPAALGAQLAAKDKKVIHIVGDGGMKMTGNELYTIASQRLPVLSIIINNSGLGMIRQLQHAFYDKRYTACCLPPDVDFTLYAKAFGVNSTAVNSAAEFVKAFDSALASDLPEVIVVNVAKNFVTPMITPGAALNEFVEM